MNRNLIIVLVGLSLIIAGYASFVLLTTKSSPDASVTIFGPQYDDIVVGGRSFGPYYYVHDRVEKTRAFSFYADEETRIDLRLYFRSEWGNANLSARDIADMIAETLKESGVRRFSAPDPATGEDAYYLMTVDAGESASMSRVVFTKISTVGEPYSLTLQHYMYSSPDKVWDMATQWMIDNVGTFFAFSALTPSDHWVTLATLGEQ